MQLRPFRLPLAFAAVLQLAGCGEPAAPTTPTASTTTPTPSTTAPTASQTAEPAGSAAPIATPSSSTSSQPTDGQCKTDAECAPGYECLQGVPLNGRCWKSGTPSPRCLASGTLIDTPSGARAIEDLRPGDHVWTLDRGARVSAPVLRVGRTPAPAGHTMRTVRLADGRSVSASATHPTCSARSAGAPDVGHIELDQTFDGARVAGLDTAAYGGRETFDLLPTSDSGCYWAGGVLLGSTLNERATTSGAPPTPR